MNAKIKTLLVTGVGVALGFIFYKVVSKVLADQGIFTGEETLMAIGSRKMFTRRPTILKAGTTTKPCYFYCRGGNCQDICTNAGGTYQAGNNSCHYPAGHKRCRTSTPHTIYK